MAGRFALIVGSQCDELPELPFVDELAAALLDALAYGQWRPAVGDGDWVGNPTTAELKSAVEEAFTNANDTGATLLIAFIGHGVARGSQDFYLLTRDARAERPNSDNAFHFTQFIRERLADFPSLDGLVFLVDACQAGQGVEGAATRWADILAANKGRMELLVASGRGSAYEGCFTRTILETFRTGLVTRGEALLCADLLPEVSKCTGQQQYLAYSGATLISGDPGLWLVPNAARSRDAVTGRPAAGLVDLLTTGVIVTASVRQSLTAIEESSSARLRLVVGTAGSGKSTLLALFIRPAITKTLGVADDYIKAAAFLDGTTTLESLAVELSTQLTATVPEYTAALEAVAVGTADADHTTLSTWDTRVRLPLTRCAESGRIHLIVDGLDQPQQGARGLILAALEHMTKIAPIPELGHVRIIAGVRSGVNVDNRSELAHAHRIEVATPTWRQLAQAATPAAGVEISESLMTQALGDATSGGWLIARLIRELADPTDNLSTYPELGALVAARARRAEIPDSEDALRALSVIAAAGVGPLLPIRLLAATLGNPDAVPLGRIRSTVVRFGALISRGHPGTDYETLGISHPVLLKAVTAYTSERGYDPAITHRAVIDTCQRFAALPDSASEATRNDVLAYWTVAAPRHHLAAGNARGAIQFLKQHETARAADNRDRWASWLPGLTATLGEEHPDILGVRHTLADWRGEAGNPGGAHAEIEALLDSSERLLGSDHPEVLAWRRSLARWQGAAGDWAGAAAALAHLLADAQRILGPDHPETLLTRREHAFWRGTAGDPAGAATETEDLLVDVRRVQGPEHPDTLTAEFLVAYWRGEAGDTAGAITALERVVSDRRRLLGPDHPDTFGARGTLAYWLGEAGDPARAAAATEQLLTDRIRVLGSDHPRTLATRHNHALWRAESGDLAGATVALADLLIDELRVLGPDHPYTLSTRSVLALVQGDGDDPAGAAASTEQLLADCTRVLGPDHPDTLATRHNLAFWKGVAGNPSGAALTLEGLLADYLRVLGPHHRDTLAAQRDLSLWQGTAASGDLAPVTSRHILGHWRRRTTL